MRFFKKLIVVVFSALFLLSLSVPLFAPEPEGGDDPSPAPPSMPGDVAGDVG
ncbi:hypothetical protein KAU34_09305 [candidate division WOR-3 bacterium]|nr:hypothetical protein [candidate division WOR-3 bacterium]